MLSVDFPYAAINGNLKIVFIEKKWKLKVMIGAKLFYIFTCIHAMPNDYL